MKDATPERLKRAALLGILQEEAKYQNNDGLFWLNFEPAASVKH